MRDLKTKVLLVLFSGLLIMSCNPGTGELEDILKGSMNIKVNPYKKVPLGGLLTFRTEVACKVEIEVAGKIPVVKEFVDYNTSHSIPVLGLYADTLNTVKIILTEENGKQYIGNIELKTNPLPEVLPSIEIVKLNRFLMEPGFHLIEMLIANNGKFQSYTVMFDDNGDIRWFMDMSSVGQIAYSSLRQKNGNWLYLSWIDMWELTDLGEEIRNEKMWMYAGTHDIIELENGNLLMAGSKKDAMVQRADGIETVTQYDHVIEWDSKQNKGVKDWDLGAVLDIDRTVFNEDYSLNFKADWFHINSIAFNPSDNSVLASGRNQGVLKVDSENNLKWILAPHKGWGKSGRAGQGFETSEFLLTAIDKNGNPYATPVQQGTRGNKTFEWSTGQHSLNILENGNILLFDNGLSRNFETTPTYSRAVEYKIDEENMTIQQVWEYGRSRGLDMYSPITSNVDVLPTTGNRLITAGNVRKGSLPPHAKMIEINYPQKKLVFEANIFLKDANGNGEQSWAQFDLAFSGTRYSLYKED